MKIADVCFLQIISSISASQNKINMLEKVEHNTIISQKQIIFPLKIYCN